MGYYNSLIPLLKHTYPKGLLWNVDRIKKEVFLTFDDGPVPGPTDFVLKVLNQYNIKATFFCVGENISKNPDVFEKIITQNHQIANHTYNHLNGWKTKDLEYQLNVEKCQHTLNTYLPHNKKLFRPPYGKITRSQADFLMKNGYKIIMWEVLTGDFDKKQNPQQCWMEGVKYTKPGSIIIFHDSYKAENNMTYALPKYIEHFLKLNFEFVTL